MAVDPQLIEKREELSRNLVSLSGIAADVVALEIRTIDQKLRQQRDDDSYQEQRRKRIEQRDRWLAEKMPQPERSRFLAQIQAKLSKPRSSTS